ncbi:MAG TPA: DUF349 domain-containing protein [Pseudolysinimonas sp.]|nr:hypothetical protein [Schumannella sp.]HEV7741660.1 DUF349 domain-containing protein [Pseudolysinimonas sp.]
MATEQAPWGRVGDDGTVFVREAEGERAVGQYPDATPEEALAYYERKFAELAGQVGLLEQRVRGGAPANDVAKAIAHLSETVMTANAVGDLAGLGERLQKLSGSVGELTEKQSAEAKAAVADALAERETLVAEAEALAAQDPAKAQWKQVTTQLDALFARWQAAQKDGPRLPKNESNDLWKRFRAARTIIETQRKAFFTELDGVHKEARNRKQELVEKAEALAPKGTAAIPDYRHLLDEWKLAGRAGKRADDALWERFKAAGDVLYAAKAEVDARENEEFAGNLTLKLELLDEAEKILTETDREKAKSALLGIQRKWDAVGKVPRDSVRPVEDRLRKVETHVRKLDEDHWNKSDPEKVARSEGFAAQLEAKIAKLEVELAEAKAKGDARKVKDAEDAITAQKTWLDALG